jgi:putative transposase
VSRIALVAVRKRRKRQRVAVERRPRVVPQQANAIWSMDFVFDALANGRPIKCLSLVAACTKEIVELAVGRRINGQGVADILEHVRRVRGYPQAIRTDQGPEFTGKALDQWAQANGVRMMLIQPGKPTQNAYVESFNGKFRGECLNENGFLTLDHVRVVISTWRRDNNQNRPHSAHGKLTPAELAAKLRSPQHLTNDEPGGMLGNPDSTK